MKKTGKYLGDRPFYDKLIHLSVPIAFESLMLAAVAAADALMLGNVEQNAMSAVSLATQIQFIQNWIITAITAGTNILGAQYWGKKDREALDDIFAISLRLAGLASVLCFVGCFFFPRYLMLLFTNEEVLVNIGVSYLKIAGWSYLLTGFVECYLSIMRVSDHASPSAYISSATVVLNIILNAILIFGWFGLPAMGVRGAATATLIARAVELIVCIVISMRKDFIGFPSHRILKFNKLLRKDFLKASMPILGASIFWGVGFASYTAFMGHMGTDAAAATSVAAVVRDLVCCLCNGLGAAGGIMVGNELGAGDLVKGKQYGDWLMRISYIIGILSTLIMLAVTPLIMHFVKLTDGAHSYLLGMMVIMAVYMIGRAVNTIIINGIFAAGGDTNFDMYSLAVVMWGLAVPLAALGTFVFHWPVLVVYACTCLDEVGKIPWVMIHYKKYKWVKDLTR